MNRMNERKKEFIINLALLNKITHSVMLRRNMTTTLLPDGYHRMYHQTIYLQQNFYMSICDQKAVQGPYGFMVPSINVTVYQFKSQVVFNVQSVDFVGCPGLLPEYFHVQRWHSLLIWSVQCCGVYTPSIIFSDDKCSSNTTNKKF